MSAPTPFSDPNLPGLSNSTGLDINTQFLLQSAYLVFFMHCGFAMVRAVALRLSCPARVFAPLMLLGLWPQLRKPPQLCSFHG